MLLTPGIITPADIKKPENIKNKILISVALFEVEIFFSNITKKTPRAREISIYIIYLNLNLSLEGTASFIKEGMLPSIKPIKTNFICIG